MDDDEVVLAEADLRRHVHVAADIAIIDVRDFLAVDPHVSGSHDATNVKDDLLAFPFRFDVQVFLVLRLAHLLVPAGRAGLGIPGPFQLEIVGEVHPAPDAAIVFELPVEVQQFFVAGFLRSGRESHQESEQCKQSEFHKGIVRF